MLIAQTKTIPGQRAYLCHFELRQEKEVIEQLLAEESQIVGGLYAFLCYGNHPAVSVHNTTKFKFIFALISKAFTLNYIL